MPDIDDGYGNANTTNTIEKVAKTYNYGNNNDYRNNSVGEAGRGGTQGVVTKVAPLAATTNSQNQQVGDGMLGFEGLGTAMGRSIVGDVEQQRSSQLQHQIYEPSFWDGLKDADLSPYTPTQAELMENPDLMTDAMWEQQRNQGYDPSNTGVNGGGGGGGDGGGNNGAAAAVAEVVPRVHGTLDDYGNGTNNSTSNNKYADNYFKAIPDSAFLPVTGTVNTGAITSPKLTGVPISYGNSRNGGRKWNSGVFGQQSGAATTGAE